MPITARRSPVPLPCALALLAAASLAPALEVPPLPADQRWAVALDVQATMAGRLGQWISRIAARDPVMPRLAVVAGMTGVDPLKDLGTVTVAGVDARPELAMLAATGRFDVEKLGTFLRSLPEYAASAHREHAVHGFTAGEPLRRLGVAIIDGAAVVGGGSAARATQAIDAFDGTAPAGDRTVMAAPAAPEGAATLLRIVAVDVAEWSGLPAEAGPARAISRIACELSEHRGVLELRARLVAIDAQSGERFASLADGAVSALALDSRTRTDPALTALVESVRIARDGAVVELAASLPIELAERAWDADIETALRESKRK